MGHAAVAALPGRRRPSDWWNKAAYFNHNNRNKYALHARPADRARPRARAAARRDVRPRLRELPRGRDRQAAARLRRPARREARHHPRVDAEPREDAARSRTTSHTARTSSSSPASRRSSGYPGDGPAQVADRLRRPERGRHRRRGRARGAAPPRADRRGPARRGGAVGGDDRQHRRVRPRLPDGRRSGRARRQPPRLARAGRVRVRDARRVGGDLRRQPTPSSRPCAARSASPNWRAIRASQTSSRAATTTTSLDVDRRRLDEDAITGRGGAARCRRPACQRRPCSRSRG